MPEREPGSLGLRLNQRTPDCMHGHAVCRGVERREQRGYLDLRLLPKEMQRPGTVFPAAPRQKDFSQIRLTIIGGRWLAPCTSLAACASMRRQRISAPNETPWRISAMISAV